MSNVPPHSIDTEKSALGAVLIDSTVLEELVEEVDRSDFYRAAHGLVFDAFRELRSAGQIVDLTTVKEFLARTGTLEAVGGAAYLSSLTDGVPRRSNVRYYGRVLRDLAHRRAAIKLASEVIVAAHSGRDLEDAVGALSRAQTVGACSPPPPTGLDLLEAPDLIPLHPRWPMLSAGSTTGLVSPPYCGKTFLALRMVGDVARVGHRVAYFALEGHGGLKQRLLALCAGLALEDADLARTIWPSSLDLSDSSSVSRAAAHCRGAQVVVIDTFARALGDLDENSANAVGKALNEITRLNPTAARLILHHTAKANAAERGSGAFRAGVDVLAFLEDEGETRILRVEKMRDGDVPPPASFRFRAVPEAKSAVLDDAARVLAARCEAELSDRSKQVLRELRMVGRATAVELVEALKGRVSRSTVFGALATLRELNLARTDGRTWSVGDVQSEQSDPKSLSPTPVRFPSPTQSDEVIR